MNDIKIFENERFGSLRTVEQSGEPWFVGKDVADTLGYQNGSRDINRHVDDEDRHKVMLFDGKQNKGLTTTRTVTIVRFDGKPDVRRETLWTMAGHRFIRDLMTKTEEV